MVVRHYIIIPLCLFIAASQVAVAASFTAKLTNNQIQLGKYTQLTLHSTMLSPSIKTVELSALETDFHVSPEPDITILGQQQTWQVRLYPRLSGNLTIPSLRFGQHTSTATALTVTPAIDPQSGNRLSLNNNVSTTTPWFNQQVLITLSITSKEPYIILKAAATELTTGKLIPIPTQSVKLTGDPHHRTRHTSGWIYIPTQAGKHILDLPPIRYRRNGIDTHRFYFPRQQITANALPVYVPINIPVGRLSLTTEELPVVLFTNKLRQLQLKFQSEGLHPHQLPRLENLLISPAGIQLYPATSTTNHTADLNGLKTETLIQVPFKATRSGLYHLKNIRLQYFDPISSKIQTLYYHWPRMLLISPWLLAILCILLLLPLTYTLRWGFLLARLRLHQYQIRKQARRQLLMATSPLEIKQAIMLMSQADGGTGNTTLQCWHQDKNVDIEPLSRAVYHCSSLETDQLKQPYLDLGKPMFSR